MLNSKHVSKSKILISALVGLTSGIALPVLRSYGYDVAITPEMQADAATIIYLAIMSFRALPTKPLYIVKQKFRSADIAKDRDITIKVANAIDSVGDDHNDNT